MSVSAGLQVKLMKLMTNVFKEQRMVDEKRESETKKRKCEWIKERQGEYCTGPLQRGDAPIRSFILFEGWVVCGHGQI